MDGRFKRTNMRIPKLIIDYTKFSDATLSLKSLNVKNSLTDNSNFPTTTPTLANYAIIQAAFDEALSKSITGDRVQIALKNQARLDLASAMRQLALDIEAQANGDKAKLLSSGFDLGSVNDSPANISVPTDFRLLDGLNAGEIKFSCKRVLHAKSYLFEYTDELPTENTKWTVLPNTSKDLTVKGLRSGIRIHGRIKAVGTKGQEACSEIQSRLVQ